MVLIVLWPSFFFFCFKENLPKKKKERKKQGCVRHAFVAPILATEDIIIFNYFDTATHIYVNVFINYYNSECRLSSIIESCVGGTSWLIFKWQTIDVCARRYKPPSHIIIPEGTPTDLWILGNYSLVILGFVCSFTD